jgi:hypothetical protein
VKHDFYLDRYGDIDVWRLDVEYHNGPQCRRCEKIECEHCEDWLDEECPSGQMELPFGEGSDTMGI